MSSLLTTLTIADSIDKAGPPDESRDEQGRWSSSGASSQRTRASKDVPMSERWMTLDNGARVPNLQVVQDRFGFVIYTEEDSRIHHSPGTVIGPLWYRNEAGVSVLRPGDVKVVILGPAKQSEVTRQRKFLYGHTRGSTYYHISAHYRARAE